MRFELVHLSGPRRGRTTVHARPRVLLGRGSADIALDAEPVRGRHEIRQVPEDCAHVIVALEGPVFAETGEVIGVNFAVTRGFQGSSFGVPIGFALELLSPDVTDTQPPAADDGARRTKENDE